MARTSEQEIKHRRRKNLVRGLVLGGAALGLPIVVNRLVRRQARQLPAPQWGEPRKTELEGGRLLYQDLEGPSDTVPVVLLHSFGPGHSGLHFREVAEALAQRRRVVVPDLLGWGASDRPSVKYSAALYTEQIGDLLAHAFDRPAAVLASGTSAALACDVAATRPELVAALGLIAPRGLEKRREGPDVRDSLLHAVLRLPLFGESALNAVTNRSAITQHLRTEVFRNEERASAHIDEHYRNAHLPGSTAPLAAALCGRLDPELTDQLDTLQVPVWVAWGREATSPSLTHADLWLAQVPKAQLQVFEDAGSHPHVEQPASFAEAAEHFLEQVDDARGSTSETTAS